jgi:hydroxypyruvate isomerase
MVWSANLGMLFDEHEPLERPAAAAACGFATIETWWPDGGLTQAWARRVRALRLAVACVNAGCASADAGGPCLNDPVHRDAAIADFEAAVILAHDVGAPAINVPVGHLDADRPTQAQFADAVAGLRDLAGIAEREGITIVIEALNPGDAPGYLVPDSATAARLIDAVGSASVRMLFDAYHCAENGSDPASEARVHADLIAHVQYADSPGRGRPGSGRSDVWELLEALADGAYDGAVGLEYRPHGPTPATLDFLDSAPAGIPIAGLAEAGR